MPRRMGRGITAKCLLGIIANWLLVACTTTLPLKPAFDEPPLTQQIEARVGSSFAIPVHTFDYVETGGAGSMIRVDFDQVSLARFEQVFSALFSDVTPLPLWPPWRETPSELDGVIELDKAHLAMAVGDDLRNPERVTVSYRVCLYTPEGAVVNCWESHAEQLHQRAAFESSLSLKSYLNRLIETASREAIARFMLAFEQDPAVRAWAEQVAERQRLR